jgi:hypothetical protein
MDQILEMRTKSSPWGWMVWVMARSVPLFFFLLCKNGWLPGKAHPCRPARSREPITDGYLFFSRFGSPVCFFWACECERPALWSFLGVACRRRPNFYESESREGRGEGKAGRKGREVGKARSPAVPAAVRRSARRVGGEFRVAWTALI